MQKIVLACVAALVSGSPELHDLERAKYVDWINNQPGVLWKAGFNPRFKGSPMGSSKSLLGVKPDNAERLRKAVEEGRVEMDTEGNWTATAIPETFDAAEKWPQCAKVITDIRDQSMCGCCWAFGAASAASDRLCIATNGTVQVPLSAQQLCFCSNPDGCGGGYLPDAWEYVQRTGLVTGGQNKGLGPFGDGWCSAFDLPHCHHHGPQGNDPYPAEGTPGCPEQSSRQCPRKCDADAVAPHNNFATDKYTFAGKIVTYPSKAASIQTAIMNKGPVEAAFTVYEDFENYVSGIYHATSSRMLGGHAIRIVGWGVENGVKYWKVANSWNPYWGENGYFRIKRGNNECGIESQIVASGPAVKWTGPGITKPPTAPPAPTTSLAPTTPTPMPEPTTPPTKAQGNCYLLDTRRECNSHQQGNIPCKWCVLSAIGAEFCELETDGC